MSPFIVFSAPSGCLLTADSCLAIQQILFPLPPVMADGKGGFNELLFSFGD